MRFWIPSVPQAATHPAGTGRAKEVPYLGFLEGIFANFCGKTAFLKTLHSKKNLYQIVVKTLFLYLNVLKTGSNFGSHVAFFSWPAGPKFKMNFCLDLFWCLFPQYDFNVGPHFGASFENFEHVQLITFDAGRKQQ